MRAVRYFLHSRPGHFVTAALITAGVLAIYFSVRRTFGPGEAAQLSRRRAMVCSKTLKGFEIDVEPGSRFPCKSPFTGRETGYPAELCYWTRDAQIGKTPTHVLMNVFAGKAGPTFCPECGRLVVARNPAPVPGKPPPTVEEYQHYRGSWEE